MAKPHDQNNLKKNYFLFYVVSCMALGDRE